MTKVEIGKKIPKFKIDATGDKKISNSDLKDKIVLLYFYPRDNTSGCTKEGQAFSDNINKFKRQNTVIYGISRDTIASHEKFKYEQKFPFDLLSDTDEVFCELFDVMKMKNMYGKQVRGIERSSFLIDPQGKLHQEWRKVKVDGHINEVLDAVKLLNKT